MASAYHLARRGCRVTVLERTGVAAGSSSSTQSLVGYGIGGDPDHLELQTAAMAAHDDLVADGVDAGFDRSGAIVVPEDAADAEALARGVDDLRTRGLQCRLLTAEQLFELEPNAAPTPAGGAFLPELAQISPMRLANELAARAAVLGAEIRTSTPVVGVDVGAGGTIRGVSTPRGTIRASSVVLAAGSWSRDVGRLAGLALPVWPRKGHVLVLEPAPGLLRRPIVDFGYGRASATPTVLLEDGPVHGPASTFGVIQPLPSGQILVGGSRQFAGIDLTIDRIVATTIAKRAVGMVPALADLRVIRTYVGFRPWTPDGFPLIGRVKRLPGLIVATGHGGEGITESVVTGRTVADLITGGVPPVDLDRLSPDRFAL